MTAQHFYYADYRTLNAPSDDNIRRLTQMFENTGATITIQNFGALIQSATSKQLEK